MRTTARLRELIDEGRLVVAPGVYDALSACLVQRAGFPVAYLSGAGTSASLIGHPDLGLLTMSEMTAHAGRVAAAVDIPVIADADTGYGNPLNVVRTVREYERAGVAGIHLEDQTFPKRCGHLAGKQVVAAEEFETKLAAALEARRDPDFLLIARSDALAVEDTAAVIDRLKRYAAAGADLLFPEAYQSVEQLKEIAAAVPTPLLANQVPGGNSPVPSPDVLADVGCRVAIYPTLGVSAAIQGMEQALAGLRDTGAEPDSLSPHAIFERVGLSHWQALENQFPSPGM